MPSSSSSSEAEPPLAVSERARLLWNVLLDRPDNLQLRHAYYKSLVEWGAKYAERTCKIIEAFTNQANASKKQQKKLMDSLAGKGTIQRAVEFELHPNAFDPFGPRPFSPARNDDDVGDREDGREANDEVLLQLGSPPPIPASPAVPWSIRHISLSPPSSPPSLIRPHTNEYHSQSSILSPSPHHQSSRPASTLSSTSQYGLTASPPLSSTSAAAPTRSSSSSSSPSTHEELAHQVHLLQGTVSYLQQKTNTMDGEIRQLQHWLFGNADSIGKVYIRHVFGIALDELRYSAKPVTRDGHKYYRRVKEFVDHGDTFNAVANSVARRWEVDSITRDDAAFGMQETTTISQTAHGYDPSLQAHLTPLVNLVFQAYLCDKTPNERESVCRLRALFEKCVVTVDGRTMSQAHYRVHCQQRQRHT